jgi:hypothetical protein
MNPTFDPAQLPLRDIHLPDAVGWWPPAAGWWLLAAVLIAAALGMGVRLYLQRRHRAASRSLDALLVALRNGEDPLACVQQASIVLRRFAMSVSPARDEVAGITGKPWTAYLDRKAPRLALADAAAAKLLDLPYVPPAEVTRKQATEFCRLCAAWVRAQPARA